MLSMNNVRTCQLHLIGRKILLSSFFPSESLALGVDEAFSDVVTVSPYIPSQVKLHFTENALRLIAKKAIAKNTGARSLRAILEKILTEAMFEV